MAHGLVRSWRLVIWRGILAVLLGLLTLFWPGLKGYQIVLLFGLYALADGLIAAGTTMAWTKNPFRWWALFLEGLISSAAGAIALIWPGLAGWALVSLIAVWGIFTGLLEIVIALRLRQELFINEWLLAWGGAISMALGVLSFFQPRPGDPTLMFGLGAYGISFGAIFILLGRALRRRNALHNRRFLRPA